MDRYQKLVTLILSSLFLLLTAAFRSPLRAAEEKADSENPAGRDLYGDPLPPLATARLGTIRWREPLRSGSGYAKVAFSPDGKLVVATGDVSFSRFCPRETATGNLVGWFPNDLLVEAAVFSPDGKALIIAEPLVVNFRSGDPFKGKQRIKHVEVGTGRIIRETEIERASDNISSFSGFSPDGSLFIATDTDKKLRLWDAMSGKPQVEIEQDLTYWDPFAFSADGKKLAVVGKDGRLIVYDTTKGKELQHFDFDRADDSVIYGFYGPALSPDGKTVLASTSKSLRFWDVETGKLRHEFEDCRGLVTFSADRKFMACGDTKGIRLWEADTLREIRRFDDPHDQFRALAFSTDSSRIVTGNDFSIAIWDVATGKQTNRVPSHQSTLCSVTFSADGTVLASGAHDGRAIVWDLRTSKPRNEFTGHYFAAVSLAFSPDGRMLATGDGQSHGGRDSREAQIRIFDLENGRLQKQFTGHLNGVVRLAFSPDGKRLASAGFDARARVWDPVTGKRHYQLKGGDGERTVVFSPDGETLLVSNTDGELSLWKAGTGEKLFDLTPSGGRSLVTYAAFLKDGKSLVSLEYQKERRSPDRITEEPPELVLFWDRESGREVRRFPLAGSARYYSNASSARTVSPDGTAVATATGIGAKPAVLLWDTASGKLHAALQGHARDISSLAFSPDGRTLASGSGDTTVLLWDVPKAKLLGAWSLLFGEQSDSEQATKLFTANPKEAVPFLHERLREAAALDSPHVRHIAKLDDEDFETREKASRQLELAGPKAEFALRMALEGKLSNEAKRRTEEVLEKVTRARKEQVEKLLTDLNGEMARDAARKIHEMGWSAEPALRCLIEKPRATIPRKDGVKEPLLSGRARWFAEEALKELRQPTNMAMPLTPPAAFRALAVLEKIGTRPARQALEETAKGPAEGALAREAKTALERLDRREKSPDGK
jgi:WD40 repeat protein